MKSAEQYFPSSKTFYYCVNMCVCSIVPVLFGIKPFSLKIRISLVINILSGGLSLRGFLLHAIKNNAIAD